MTQDFDPDPAARLIAETTRARTRLTELPPGQRPATLAQGYDVQDRLIAALGDPVSGWKLGQGSPKGLRAAKLERALVGRVTASRCHASGATIALPVAAPVTVEIEIAFRLARDIEPTGPLPAARDVIASACLASEVILSRFVDRKAVGLPSYLAENVGFEALIVGPAIEMPAIPAVMSSVVVDLEGERVAAAGSTGQAGMRVATAQIGEDAIDPWRAVDHLLAHARDRGMILRAGELVSTGTISQPFDCDPQQWQGRRVRVAARAGGLDLSFTLAWPA